jgi:hypothetical protein
VTNNRIGLTRVDIPLVYPMRALREALCVRYNAKGALDDL